MQPMITVHKLDHQGNEKTVYQGEVVTRSGAGVLLEARFTLERMELDYVTLTPGDRFVEYFYSDRWYNVFLIFDAESGDFKGWYCNVTRPARIEDEHLWADDLALDYFVQPDGREFVLDEDEFAALSLAPEEAHRARAALAELRGLAARGEAPFDPATVARFRSEEHRG